MSNRTEFGVTDSSIDFQKIVEEEVTPKRQMEVSRKYGVSEKAIEAMLSETASEEEKTEALGEIFMILGNAFYNNRVAIQDYKIVTYILGPRFN